MTNRLEKFLYELYNEKFFDIIPDIIKIIVSYLYFMPKRGFKIRTYTDAVQGNLQEIFVSQNPSSRFFGSQDRYEIKIYDTFSGKIKNFIVTKNMRTYVQLTENLFLVLSCDNLLEIHDSSIYLLEKNIKTISGQYTSITKINSCGIDEKDGNILCGTKDKKIVLLNLFGKENTFTFLGKKMGEIIPTKTLVGHDGFIRNILYLSKGKYKGFVLSGDWRYTMKLWNLEQEKCIETFDNLIPSIQLFDGSVMCVTHIEGVSFVNFDLEEKKKRFEIKVDCYNGFDFNSITQISDGSIVLLDKNMTIFDNYGNKIKQYKPKKEEKRVVSILQLQNGDIVESLSNGKLLLLTNNR